MTVYILTVSNDDESFIMPFTTKEKAASFVENNFHYDNPRVVTNDFFEGKSNQYIITQHTLDQESF